MALRTVRIVNDDILHKVSRPVVQVNDKTRQLLDDMLETMYHYNGVGLAAVQVGILRRLLVIDVTENGTNPVEFINPEVISHKGSQTGWEGCLSIPGQSGKVVRPAVTVVRAINRFGQPFEMRCNGQLAVALNHELDHLDGVLYTQRAVEIRRQGEEEDG
ncbi:MAG: peptide deformylase [Clostridiales bacterium]|jgi:peptide deformylase|nr:peptide deformylase [Clostridiales bacterium]